MISTEEIFSDLSGGPLLRERKNSARKVRLFQTYMSDEELGQCDIVTISPPSNDLIWRSIFDIEAGDSLPHVPFLHRFTQPKSFLKFDSTPNVSNFRRMGWEFLFDSRIQELRVVAEEDEIEISEASIQAAKLFLARTAFVVHPSIFLSPNGNIRLVWRNAEGEQIGVHFRIDDTIQYVFFRLSEGVLETSMGVARSSSVVSLIQDLDLGRLMLTSD